MVRFVPELAPLAAAVTGADVLKQPLALPSDIIEGVLAWRLGEFRHSIEHEGPLVLRGFRMVIDDVLALRKSDVEKAAAAEPEVLGFGELDERGAA
jgi:hypothetical protein